MTISANFQSVSTSLWAARKKYIFKTCSSMPWLIGLKDKYVLYYLKFISWSKILDNMSIKYQKPYHNPQTWLRAKKRFLIATFIRNLDFFNKSQYYMVKMSLLQRGYYLMCNSKKHWFICESQCMQIKYEEGNKTKLLSYK